MIGLDGTAKTGMGPAATVVADEPGKYSAWFDITGGRDKKIELALAMTPFSVKNVARVLSTSSILHEGVWVDVSLRPDPDEWPSG